MHRVFGTRENVKYTDREGAYLIPFHGNQVGVVRTPKGFFFLGGGLNDGESHIECIKRECVEEAGCEISIKDAVCSAETYYKHETMSYFHPIQTYYMGDVVSEGQATSESDHEFMWVEYETLKGKMFLEMQNWALEECLKYRNKIEWIFFDVGSTLVNEQFAYEHRMRDIADLANTTYEIVYETAKEFYKQNKKGDLETAKLLGVNLTGWHVEDEVLYSEAVSSLKELSSRYKIGIIANQNLGTESRLEKYGVLQYVDLVIASAEEGVSKPDKRIFEIALARSNCKAEHAIMVGDRVDNDIVPAKRLGMKTIWIKQGFGKYWNVKSENEKADYVVQNLREICEIL